VTLPRWLPVLLLFVVAVATGWMVWQLNRGDEPPPLVGPPRSDYLLMDFELVSLDEKGSEAFRVNGPMLSRHPYLGTLDVQQPRFLFPDSEGKPWNARAGRAWVAQRGDELRLTGAVEFDGPRDAEGGRIELRSPELTVLPEANEVRTDAAVTVTGPGSILRGRGLRADLDARRFQLSETSGEYVPSTR
jgi:lipopolysaccharide export system protein LptC